MDNEKNLEELYGHFINFQMEEHEKNQKKIRVGLKVNILLPLVFLIISFITEGSKLVFLILWIVSLFGISFYLLYVEYTDTKMQEKLKEFGIVDDEENHKALIGSEVLERMDDLENFVDLDVFTDIKELRAGIKDDLSDLRTRIEERRGQETKEESIFEEDEEIVEEEVDDSESGEENIFEEQEKEDGGEEDA